MTQLALVFLGAFLLISGVVAAIGVKRSDQDRAAGRGTRSW
jgi:hypothetical protein